MTNTLRLQPAMSVRDEMTYGTGRPATYVVLGLAEHVMVIQHGPDRWFVSRAEHTRRLPTFSTADDALGALQAEIDSPVASQH